MFLFLVHCGFPGDGIFEAHTNFFVVAEDTKEAWAKAKERPDFKEKRMHIDGLLKVEVADEHLVLLEPVSGLKDKITSYGFRDLKELRG